MSLFTKLGNEIASPVDAAGNPRAVENVDMQRWMTEVERATLAFQAGGGIIFPDLETANASLAYAQNQMAWVIGDPVPANNGVYRKIGASGSGSWARLGDLPISMIRLDNAGAGTADAIIAEPMLPLPTTPGAALLTVNILAANTGSVTLNGKPLRTNSGNEIAPGSLTAGSIHAFLDLGDHFRLLSDQASAAIVAAAEAARDAAMSAVPNAFPVDRAALKLLDTNSITAAYLKEQGWEGQWLWDAAVPIATHQADDFEQRYIAPDPAEDGAWVRAGTVQTGGRFTNDSPAPRIHRFADRVFVGDAVAYNGARDGDAEGSWLFDDTGGTYTREWMEAAAQFASVSSAGIAFTGAARGGPGKGSSIGVIGFGMSYGDGGDYDNAYGFYGEGIRGNPNASAWAMELNSVNLHPSPAGTNPFTPFGTIHSSMPNGLGTTLGLTLMAGGDPIVNPVTYDSDVALEIGNNGARWLTGINFDDNALYRHPDGRSYAINLARGHMLTWYDDAMATWSPAFRISSEISHSDYYREIYANDSGVGVRNEAGDVLFRVGHTLGDTGIEILPDAAPAIAPVGAAADINIVVRGKGLGGGRLVSGGVEMLSWGYGVLGFHGAAPIVKQEVAGSKDGNAALTSLLQKLAAIGLITDSTT